MRNLLIGVASLFFTLTLNAFEFTGKVVGVTDGDTITVLYQGNKQYKVRLQHIDSPEVGQPFGAKAKQALSAKVFGKEVTIKWDEMDRFKRILGEVYIDKRWINPELVSEGMAWHYKFYSKDKTMATAETKARTAKLGIWSQPNPTAPWDFRRGKGDVRQEIGQANTPVFLTRSGTKYHRADCRSLAKSKVPSTLAKVTGHYGPCSLCKPPVIKVQAQPEPNRLPEVGAANQVFVTKSGSKYHRDGCRSLSKSKIAIALANARKRYGPCKVCKPPQ